MHSAQACLDTSLPLLAGQRQCKEIQDGKWSMYKRADQKWTALRAKTQQVAVGRFWTNMCFVGELKGGKADNVDVSPCN